jgi:hypothetical protein
MVKFWVSSFFNKTFVDGGFYGYILVVSHLLLTKQGGKDFKF